MEVFLGKKRVGQGSYFQNKIKQKIFQAKLSFIGCGGGRECQGSHYVNYFTNANKDISD